MLKVALCQKFLLQSTSSQTIDKGFTKPLSQMQQDGTMQSENYWLTGNEQINRDNSASFKCVTVCDMDKVREKW